MILFRTEIRKWKRNKTAWGLFLMITLFGIFALQRSFSISRESPFMDSFGDLYTLAFKNLTGFFGPIALGLSAAQIFYEERRNDTLKGLLMIPVSRTQLFFTKSAVLLAWSLLGCLYTFLFCIAGALLGEGFADFGGQSVLEAAGLFLAGGVLVPAAMLPVFFLAAMSRGYLIPIAGTLFYLGAEVVAPGALCGFHPLASLLGVYQAISPAAGEMVKSMNGGAAVPIAPGGGLMCVIAAGVFFSLLSVFLLNRQKL